MFARWERYSFALPLPDGGVEIGFLDAEKMLAVIIAARNMQNAPLVVMDLTTGERSEAEIPAAVRALYPITVGGTEAARRPIQLFDRFATVTAGVEASHV